MGDLIASVLSALMPGPKKPWHLVIATVVFFAFVAAFFALTAIL